MELHDFWFFLICVLWSGYFVLEGFDFGVGMLIPVLGRSEEDRGTLLGTIGPVWDGNEVWLVTASGATFAAFPQWYATMFSGFYIALLLVLVLLIVRVVSFEWREKVDSDRWQGVWTGANVVASYGIPLLWGIALTSLLAGVPVGEDKEFTGNVFDLFSWYSVLGGVAFMALFAWHGSVFVTLRTTGAMKERAHHLSLRLAPFSVLLTIAFLAATLWTGVDANEKGLVGGLVIIPLAVAALLVAWFMAGRRREGVAFASTCAAIVLAVTLLFVELFPRVMVSSTDFAWSLTTSNASSSHYTLVFMTIVALVMTPVVLLYQGWTYYVFRARLGQVEPVKNPIDLLAEKPKRDR